ncbi:MBL fold metallo-hydrolase [Stygiolobus caldivivus]|uniref:Uncharacterized protein n=1 Tax=Stygiolobus caldivivus TaxID=2824673 RepID=A0A8D5U754_9CREN|nr:MBL fold metallo-hydrolase [Stygiolobus caldivivus]BCU70548.1 hypothetical protein KN1_18450 [Stygiolobus caldivivus]
MISKLLSNTYVIRGNFLVYLIEIDDGLVVIDASDGSDLSIVIDGIYEISEKISKKPKLLILTSYLREVAGGANFLSRFFSIPVISSKEIAPVLRKGGNPENSYEPINISIEVKNKSKVFLNDILDLNCSSLIEIIKSNTPVIGSIFIKYNSLLFTGSSGVSGLKNKISYICNAYNFEKVS